MVIPIEIFRMRNAMNNGTLTSVIFFPDDMFVTTLQIYQSVVTTLCQQEKRYYSLMISAGNWKKMAFFYNNYRDKYIRLKEGLLFVILKKCRKCGFYIVSKCGRCDRFCFISPAEKPGNDGTFV